MWGFNVTDKTFPYDNRPVTPLRGKNFSEWWFHNHLAYPPNPGDFFELPAGSKATAEIACTKDATSYWAMAPDGGRDTQDNENPCPGSSSLAYHTNGIDDLEGCALGIAYKDKVEDVKPEDFTIFSVNQTCVWTRHTDFEVPERMPACPEGGCICAFFWVHSPKAGGEESKPHFFTIINDLTAMIIDYMNGFRCKVTNATSTVALAKPEIPRRCGADPENHKQYSIPSNCTYGAKQPFYWLNDDSNMFEGEHAPPVYNDLYNFADGAQNDIFVDSYESKPDPGVVAPLPVFADVGTALKQVLGMQGRIMRKVLANEGVNLNLNDTTTDDSGSTSPQHAKSCKQASAALTRRNLASGGDVEVDPRLFRRYVPRALLRMTHTSRRLGTDKGRLWHMW